MAAIKDKVREKKGADGKVIIEQVINEKFPDNISVYKLKRLPSYGSSGEKRHTKYILVRFLNSQDM